jgi:CheY-like chemotaxis protein
LGVPNYLVKPVFAQELRDVILRASGPTEGQCAETIELDRPPQPKATRNLRVLLVEDNAVNRKLVSCLLRNWGHTVVVAHNGLEALAAAQNSSLSEFDLILMDMQMPEMDGIETTAAIREYEGLTGGHVPIIAVTAHAMSGDRERCLDAGMDGYLSKPIQIQELHDLMRRFEETATQAPLESHAEQAEQLPPSGEDEPLDLPALWDRVGGDSQLLGELVDIYLCESPSMLAAAQQALQNKDGRELARVAHTLKGSVGNFSARSTRELAERLEGFAEQGDFSSARTTMNTLEQAMERLDHALNSLRGVTAT